MKGLSEFVMNEFKKDLFKDAVIIESFEDIDDVVNSIAYGDYGKYSFKNSALKDKFFDMLSTHRPDVNIINCNCSIDKFNESSLDGLVVFNNVKHCKHFEIILEIKKQKGILIC